MTIASPESARAALIDELTGAALQTRAVWRWLLIGLFLGGIALLAFVPVDSGVAAQGLLHTTKARQIVQHPTGGVVRQILVRDGQKAAVGQALIKLDDSQERAAYSVAKFQAISLRAELAIRQAEVQGREPVFPPDLTSMASRERDVQEILISQLAAFAARKQSFANQTAQAKQQLEKNAMAAKQAQARATAASKQLALVQEESVSMRTLLEKGLTLKSRVLALERAEASLTGDTASFSAEVGRLKAENAEIAKRLEQPELASRLQAPEAMRTVTADLTAAQDRFLAARTAFERTVLRAPMAGTVMSSRAATIGGVIRAGEPVMEIVPDDHDLELRARIRLADADNIAVGNQVSIRFDMMQGTAAPTITGAVTTISADAVEDPRTGDTFFEAKISIPPDQARRVPANMLAPGRPAEVLIRTGQRTLLSHFLAPFDRAQFRGMREN